MDVDGTLTNGRIYMGPNGEAMKAFDIKDGYGIHDILPNIGVEPVILTGRFSEIVIRRCNELGIKYVMQGVKDKLSKLKDFISGKNVTFKNVAYIGDDLNDMPCMMAILTGGGLVGCPKDAVKEVRLKANVKCKSNGGQGAVREFIEYLGDYNKKTIVYNGEIVK